MIFFYQIANLLLTPASTKLNSAKLYLAESYAGNGLIVFNIELELENCAYIFSTHALLVLLPVCSPLVVCKLDE